MYIKPEDFSPAKTEIKTILPRTPSVFLALAMKDMDDCMGKPDYYKIDMSSWATRRSVYDPDGHVPPHEECSICLAGSILEKEFSPGEVPSEFGNQKSAYYCGTSNGQVLCAIDSFREGQIATAFATLGLFEVPWKAMETYYTNREVLYTDEHIAIWNAAFPGLPHEVPFPKYVGLHNYDRFRKKILDLVELLKKHGH